MKRPVRKGFQSTHLLRGATMCIASASIFHDDFNPRTSCEVRLYILYNRNACRRKISIHAPLARCDLWKFLLDCSQQAFQSTHLLRGATMPAIISCLLSLFQSTHLLRGATWIRFCYRRPCLFQSTHLLRGATLLTDSML